MRYKRVSILTMLTFVSFLMSSCNALDIISFQENIDDIDAFQDDNGNGYNKISNFKFNLADVNKSVGQISLQSVGESKILVVPVECSDGPKWTSDMLNRVNIAFFGKAEETGWQSVSSFYETSSYGKLKISGSLAPTLKLNYTVDSLAVANIVDNSSRPDEVVYKIFEKDATYDDLRKEYDTDDDGYVDSVVFVYSNKIDTDDFSYLGKTIENGYWAWVYWGDSKYIGASNPIINSYMWVSYNFIYGTQSVQSNYPYAAYTSENKVDSHTIIHETGHLLGLDDYYSYDENSWDPSGAIEMHSNNVGDENIFSKMSLGWVEPYYVKIANKGDKVNLTLRSSAKYGDAILLNDTWNNSPCDEYIIIEYYSPNLLNYKDAIKPYAGNGFRMYTESGFRIYHIDSRVVELVEKVRNGYTIVGFADELKEGSLYKVGPSNSPSKAYLNSHEDDFKLVHLMEAGGENTFIESSKTGSPIPANNDTLYKNGSSFKANKNFFYYGDKFNDGTVVGYKISIGQCEKTYGTLTIEKL